MNDTPTAKQERSARAWREAKTGRDAWVRFAAWLTRTEPVDDVSDAPYWDTAMHGHQLWTGPTAKRLVLFQKLGVMNAFLPDGRGSDHGSRWGIATATAPFAPRAFDVELVRAHAKMLKSPVGFVGDLDPHGLHVYYALRGGNLEMSGRGLPLQWLGVDDAWLRRVRRTKRPMLARTIRMGWIEREYWAIVKRLAPDVRSLVGDESFALLESGSKLESDAFADVLVASIRVALESTETPR